MVESIEPWLLDILVCPESKTPLILIDGWLYSTDPQSRRRYAIEDGIPNLLIDESEVVSETEFEQVMNRARKS